MRELVVLSDGALSIFTSPVHDDFDKMPWGSFAVYEREANVITRQALIVLHRIPRSSRKASLEPSNAELMTLTSALAYINEEYLSTYESKDSWRIREDSSAADTARREFSILVLYDAPCITCISSGKINPSSKDGYITNITLNRLVKNIGNKAYLRFHRINGDIMKKTIINH